MKFKVAVLVLGLCSFVAAGLIVRVPDEGQIPSRSSVRVVMLADGAEPAPPWPGSGSALYSRTGGTAVA